ncbi:MAG: carbohydrate ABC transporter permease [Elusimicrobia bacterium]|nr:carbohydrate ABC transporter permease [Elusimicrobiota bacterium]
MKRRAWTPWLFGAAAAAVVLWSLGPFLWQVVTSLKPSAEVISVPPRYWPSHPTLASYSKIFATRPFGTYILNSVIVALSTTVLCALTGTLAAYAFARLPLPGGKWAIRFILFVAIFPPTILIVPLYRMVRAMHLLNNPLGLILPYTALNLPFAVWVLMTFFKQIPRDIEEAAAVDGLSRWQTLWKIVFPLSAPAVATTAILVFIFSWNEFLLALTFMSRDSARTVPVGIAMLSGVTMYEVPWDQISAAVVITTLPVVALVLAFQRRIVEGLTAGAVKG